MNDHELHRGVMEAAKAAQLYYKRELARVAALLQVAESDYHRALRLKPAEVNPETEDHARKWPKTVLREFFNCWWRCRDGKGDMVEYWKNPHH